MTQRRPQNDQALVFSVQFCISPPHDRIWVQHAELQLSTRHFQQGQRLPCSTTAFCRGGFGCPCAPRGNYRNASPKFYFSAVQPRDFVDERLPRQKGIPSRNIPDKVGNCETSTFLICPIILVNGFRGVHKHVFSTKGAVGFLEYRISWRGCGLFHLMSMDLSKNRACCTSSICKV